MFIKPYARASFFTRSLTRSKYFWRSWKFRTKEMKPGCYKNNNLYGIIILGAHAENDIGTFDVELLEKNQNKKNIID